MFSNSALYSPLSLRKKCRAATSQNQETNQGLGKTMNATVCGIWQIFIFNSMDSHKKDLIGSPMVSQYWGTSSPLGMTQNSTSLSFQFTAPSSAPSFSSS